MPQREIEIILARQLAGYLATPIFLVDALGTLAFYNEPAEAILGCRFEETGEMKVEEWSTIFKPVDANGDPLKPEELPLVVALRKHHPVHRSLSINGLDGIVRHIEVTAFPLIGQADRFIGAIAVFWEVNHS